MQFQAFLKQLIHESVTQTEAVVKVLVLDCQKHIISLTHTHTELSLMLLKTSYR